MYDMGFCGTIVTFLLRFRLCVKPLGGILDVCWGFVLLGFVLVLMICFVVKPAICCRLELLAELEQGNPP